MFKYYLETYGRIVVKYFQSSRTFVVELVVYNQAVS
jgi:hypothetical protein